MAVKASNQITIVDVTDAYSVLLTSEAYTFAGDTTGALAGLSCTTQVTAYQGTQQCSKISVSTIKCPSGISATISDNNTASPTITFKTTATISETCEAEIPIVIDEATFNKKFTFSVAKTGAKGDKGDTGASGKGITSTEVNYQASSNGTAIPTGTWFSDIPSVSAGQYLWTRVIITYTDKTTTTSYSIGKVGDTGAKGDPGTSGRGVKSTNVTYQAAANGTDIPTGEWTSTVPVTTAEMPYLWSRTVFTYTDDTTSTSYAVGSTPEGVLDTVNAEISDVRSEFKATADSISGEVSSVTTKLYDLSSRVDTNASSFQQFADSINATIINTMVGSGEWAGLTEEMTAIKATATGLSMDVSKVTQNLDGFMSEYHTYFTATADGLQISKSGSEFATLLSDTKLSFTQSGEEVAYIQYNKLYITEAWVKSGLSIESSTNGSYIRQYVDSNGLFCIQIKEGE